MRWVTVEWMELNYIELIETKVNKNGIGWFHFIRKNLIELKWNELNLI